MHRAYQ